VLTKLYDSVVCISIPDWYHDHDLFDQQVGKLKRIVAKMLLSQVNFLPFSWTFSHWSSREHLANEEAEVRLSTYPSAMG
jgi:hypothetical protein